ncbi:hypothetical protein ACIB24_03570 [Spongisporangium articulatum]|uniref:Uncharacterized protein n=1 Tax=Spongisporangium articulatum TaxID=3362603 RepID=A0ABW8AIF2_9ACTN
MAKHARLPAWRLWLAWTAAAAMLASVVFCLARDEPAFSWWWAVPAVLSFAAYSAGGLLTAQKGD